MNKLFSIKGFLPYTVMLFLNAFVDLGHKIVIQNTVFKIYDGQTQVILTAIVNALILLPYIFLFSPSGYISDKYPKHWVMRYSAMVEVFTVSLVIVAYYFGWFWLAFALTLFMAIQSAVYSPAKYGYIRELVGDENLSAANGVVQAATIIAILGGTLVFSAVFEWMLKGITLNDPGQILQLIYPVGFLILFFAALEYLLAFYLPGKREVDTRKSFSLDDYLHGRYLKNNIAAITQKPVIWLSIVGLLVFWSASQVVLASFPAFAKEVLSETNTLVIQGILASTGIGIMLGSLFAGRVSKHAIELSLIPCGVIGFSLLIGVIPMLHSAVSMALTFILIGFFGGIYIVPLNALMQYHSPDNDIGTVLAGNNWLQNIVMCLALGLTIMMAWFGFNSVELFYCLMVICSIFALYITGKIPYSLARLVFLFSNLRAQLDISGFAHLPKHRGVLLVGNFTRWTDFMLVQIACPNRVHFVLIEDSLPAGSVFRKALYRWFGVQCFSTHDIANAYQAINRQLLAGEFVCLQESAALQYHQCLDQNVFPANALPPHFVLFTIVIADKSKVAVILGKPFSLHVSAEELKMHLSELPFQARKYLKDHENE